MSDCVFCAFLAGAETEWNRRAGVVRPGNPDNVIAVPNEHVADLASCPDDLLGELYAAAKRVAAAMRAAYGCEGTSTRQHDGAAAGQEIDHLHVHVFARHTGDRLYERNGEHRFASPEERAPYAARLREALSAG